MAWCRQAGDHYLNQFWPSSMSRYGVPGPQSQCVNRFRWNFQDGSEIIQGTRVPMGMDHHLDLHYNYAIMSATVFQIIDVWLFAQPFVQAQIKENIKTPHHWPLWGESTGDRWIPLTKGRLRGKCIHLMTSSWKMFLHLRLASDCSTVIKYLQEHYEFICRYPVTRVETSGLMKAHRMFVANRISNTCY